MPEICRFTSIIVNIPPNEHNKVIDAVAQRVIGGRTGTIQPTEIIQATIEILPWAKRATVSLSVNRMFGRTIHP